jgi:hypothetical protein
MATRNNPNSIALRWLKNGHVGIGTANPETALHINTPSDVHAGLTIRSGGSWSAVLNQSPTSLFTITNGGAARLTIQAGGNVGIGTLEPANRLHVLGGATFASGSAGANQSVAWVPGSASWSFTSDRATKEQIESVNTREVLEKLLQVPIAEWNYIGHQRRHVGPMAQDFHAQFPLSPDDTQLNDADLHGVALAAIHGLNQKLEETRSEFSWFKGGAHTNTQNNPGPGGLEMMRLDASGNLLVRANITANSASLSSDRERKENFKPVDPQAVLEKVAALPLSEWNFKGEGVRHLGPMAQDFHAAFGLGTDERHITTVDADGVALAAIQGLNAKIEGEKQQREKLEAENAELKARLEKLEQLLAPRMSGGAR